MAATYQMFILFKVLMLKLPVEETRRSKSDMTPGHLEDEMPSISFQCSTKQATQRSLEEGGAGPQNHKHRKTWRERRRHTKEHDCRHAPLDHGNASPDVGKRPQDKGAKENAQHHADHQDNILPVAYIPLILGASSQVSEHVALHGHKGSGRRNNCTHSGKQPGGTEIMQLFHGFNHSLEWPFRREGHSN